MSVSSLENFEMTEELYLGICEQSFFWEGEHNLEFIDPSYRETTIIARRKNQTEKEEKYRADTTESNYMRR